MTNIIKNTEAFNTKIKDGDVVYLFNCPSKKCVVTLDDCKICPCYIGLKNAMYYNKPHALPIIVCD